MYFSSFGYDIYNSSSDFYTSVCSSASINDSDITLSDRYTDYYPSNITFCNDSCELSYVDLDNLIIECNCDIGYNFSDNKDSEENEEEEDNGNYF